MFVLQQSQKHCRSRINVLFFLVVDLRISSRHDAPSPPSSCVFSTNKGISLLITIRKFILTTLKSSDSTQPIVTPILAFLLNTSWPDSHVARHRHVSFISFLQMSCSGFPGCLWPWHAWKPWSIYFKSATSFWVSLRFPYAWILLSIFSGSITKEAFSLYCHLPGGTRFQFISSLMPTLVS